jgi:prepilin signal peptidase PulO-like enzyme (type II secretory pathway)
LTALLFIGSFIYWPFELIGVISILYFSLWLIFLVVLIALAVYDSKHMLLPNQMIAVGWGITMLAIAVSLGMSGATPTLLDMLVGSVTFGGLFYLLFLVSGGKWIGGGDVKLGFLLGVWLAGVASVFLTIFLASIFGILSVVVTSLSRSVSLKDHIPFGPMLILATVVNVLFFDTIYEALLGNLLII